MRGGGQRHENTRGRQESRGGICMDTGQLEVMCTSAAMRARLEKCQCKASTCVCTHRDALSTPEGFGLGHLVTARALNGRYESELTVLLPSVVTLLMAFAVDGRGGLEPVALSSVIASAHSASLARFLSKHVVNAISSTIAAFWSISRHHGSRTGLVGISVSSRVEFKSNPLCSGSEEHEEAGEKL